MLIISCLLMTSLFSDENYTRQGIVVADKELGIVWQDNEAAATKLDLKDTKIIVKILILQVQQTGDCQIMKNFLALAIMKYINQP